MQNRAVLLFFNLNVFKIFQTSWSVSVELVIGPDVGISYWTDKGATPTVLAEFHQVRFWLKKLK